MRYRGRLPVIAAVFVCVSVVALTGGRTDAASHMDAPLIWHDPQANLSDVYAFIGTKYDDPGEKVLNVIVQVHSYCEPGAGPFYDRFDNDARYSIHIVNPESGAEALRYDFQFSSSNPTDSPGLKNDDTILSYGSGTETGPIMDVGDARQNYTQTYSVKRVRRRASTVIGSELLTPPPNVGPRTTPFYNDSLTGKAVSGATNFNELDSYTQQTLHSLPSGEAVFAGQRENGFYADMSGIFDLLDPRILDNNGNSADGLGQDGGGVDGFQGYNVLAFAIQIPVDSLPSYAYTAPFADLANPLPADGEANGVGVYASVSRPRLLLRHPLRAPISFGLPIQVSRTGNPLFEELFIALKDKDKYNRTSPAGDNTGFAMYALEPELASLLNLVFGTSFAETGRSDLAAVFIPEVLRVDTTTPPVRLAGQSGFSRFGFFGGDTTTDGNGRVKSSGWPNGRRLGDDVVDILLTLVASGPAYSSVTLVGDNVAANDQIYHQVFPYAATPHSGPYHSKDSGVND
jgi:hypothetical protein